MKIKWLTFFLSTVAVLTFLGFACDRAQVEQGGLAAKNLSADQAVASSPFTSCTSDFNCRAVKADCCGCNQGGKQTTVSLNAVSGWNHKLQDSCKGRMCTQMISNDPSCTKTPKCRNNTCVLE